jgi:hypothetical protein
MTMRQPKCGTDARCEGCWTDCGYPSDDVPELVSGDSTYFHLRDLMRDLVKFKGPFPRIFSRIMELDL